ncbi:hypothetical protein OAC89_02005 [Deltaproteobacteria bacterium]|nr:hypothetical protein [Deltaproteobacteria bacterium]
MNEVLFIGAGTQGAKKIGNNFQPYIQIHGKTCIEHVFDAACNSRVVKQIYIWGNKRRLETLLHDRIEALPRTRINVKIVNGRKTPFDSFFFAYLDYIADDSLKEIIKSWKDFEDVDWNILVNYAKNNGILDRQISLILSDTPLITSPEIDYMISNMDKDLDIILGRTLQNSFERVLEGTKEKFAGHLAVKNFYNYIIKKKEVGLIVNSFFAGKPLRVDRRFWGILIKFYENRTIIEGRRFNLTKIKNNYNYIRKFLFSQPYEESGKKSSIMKSNWFILKAYRNIIKDLKSEKRYRDLSILFSKIQDVTGLKIGYQVSECVGAAFDIDTRYEADFINKNYDMLMQNINRVSL